MHCNDNSNSIAGFPVSIHHSYAGVPRLLHRLEPNPEDLWQEVQSLVQLQGGVLVIDDSTLDKQYAQKIERVSRQWSGKHRRVVKGINLTTLLWTDGDQRLPCDYRLYDQATDGATKNDHFRTLMATAKERGFVPDGVAFDSWFSALENLKLIRSYGWIWLTRLKQNRLVNPDAKGNRRLEELELSDKGTVVHLKGYGFIKIFKIVAPDGDIDDWATNDLDLNALQRLQSDLDAKNL